MAPRLLMIAHGVADAKLQLKLSALSDWMIGRGGDPDGLAPRLELGRGGADLRWRWREFGPAQVALAETRVYRDVEAHLDQHLAAAQARRHARAGW